MRKKMSLFLALALVFLTVGCGAMASVEPNQIKYKNKVLNYGTSEVDDVFFDDGIELVINDSNVVRCISVTNEYVDTYKGISVGDKISKVKSKYKHESTFSDSAVCVVMDGNKEIDSTAQDKPDDVIWIIYFHEGEYITRIMIYDAVYAMYIM